MTESDQSSDLLDLGGIAAAMGAAMAGVPLEPVAQACPDLLKELRAVHPVKAAATFGSLLTQKRLQPNCLRLEALVHLCVATGKGSRAPIAQLLIQGYTAVGYACGYMEDPPEDIFVGNVYSKRGNYRVLEGIWEGGTFYLQRFVNLTDSLPATGDFSSFANSIHALLKVSDIVCARAGLKRNELGSAQGEQSLLRNMADKSSKLRRLVQFGFDDLREADIDIDDLRPFIFNPTERSELLKQSITNSDLEAHPLALDGDQLYLLLPTAISAAIRRYFLMVLGSEENRKAFLYNLGEEYSRLFDETPMFGKRGGNVPFVHRPWGSVCCMSRQVDEGRYLNLVFFMDTLEDFTPDSFAGMYLGNDRLYQELKRATAAMQDDASKRPGFRDGITLIVGCGVGRGAALPTPVESRENWEVEFLSAPDYCTLSRAKAMEPLDLWRIIQMRLRLEQMDVWLQNMNGFLNLYAWAKSLDGHLVPHADIPDEASGEKRLHLSIVQNSLLDLRHEVANSVDLHVEQFVDGTWRLVLTEGSSYFEEDDRQPLYGHLRFGKDGGPLGACITPNRCWWYEVASPAEGPDTATYDRWKMVGTWLVRAVRPLEHKFEARLGTCPILWRCVFERPQDAAGIETPGTAQEAMEAIRTTVNVEQRCVELNIGPGFDRALHHHENIAERALVTAFAAGVARLAGSAMAELEGLIQAMVPNTQARHSHMFFAQHFRDYMHSLLAPEPIMISRFDDAAIKLGMGWQVRDPADGGRIEGKVDCLCFLNTLVQRLEYELCRDLRSFNRARLLSKLLFNHEVASASRERWHRTAAAILALRDNKGAALITMRDHEHKLNAVFQSGRNLMEMALCESPADGGQTPGDLDLSRLLTKAAQLYHLGGWSDLLRWDFLEPILVVRALGDVHAKHDFMDTVMEGFGSATSKYRYMASAQNYAKNLERPKVFANSNDNIEEKFLAAWADEFAIEIDAFRRFLDAVENWAIEHQKPVVQMRRSELIALAESSDVGLKIVESMSLVPRPSWHQLPDGYDNKDIAFWRFRRRLSVLRRPLLQLTVDDDPPILFAPGLLREGFAHTVGNYFSASYPDWHLGPAMKRYVGYARARDGMRFNREVAGEMSKLGWQAHPEITPTKILGKALDRNYGDVDVLAWEANGGRILVMECKDLQFRKTYGEIAEQLSDFRGEVSEDGKRRDLLRKHLDRVEVLRNHAQQVKKYLGLSGDCTIESHIVFRHPVPMQFSEGLIREHAKLHIFADLHKLKLD